MTNPPALVTQLLENRLYVAHLLLRKSSFQGASKGRRIPSAISGIWFVCLFGNRIWDIIMVRYFLS